MSELRVIVGLGNPGPQYSRTRHNAGFWFIEALAARQQLTLKPVPKLYCRMGRGLISGCDCLLVQPDTFVNRSGQAVRAVMSYYKLEYSGLLVVYDELDLEPGIARIKQGGGHGGHNGLRDIFAHLGSREFTRLRIGIGHPGASDQVSAYVLSKASKTDQTNIEHAIEAALNEVPLLVAGDISTAMLNLHTPAK